MGVGVEPSVQPIGRGIKRKFKALSFQMFQANRIGLFIGARCYPQDGFAKDCCPDLDNDSVERLRQMETNYFHS